MPPQPTRPFVLTGYSVTGSSGFIDHVDVQVTYWGRSYSFSTQQRLMLLLDGREFVGRLQRFNEHDSLREFVKMTVRYDSADFIQAELQRIVLACEADGVRQGGGVPDKLTPDERLAAEDLRAATKRNWLPSSELLLGALDRLAPCPVKTVPLPPEKEPSPAN